MLNDRVEKVLIVNEKMEKNFRRFIRNIKREPNGNSKMEKHNILNKNFTGWA